MILNNFHYIKKYNANKAFNALGKNIIKSSYAYIKGILVNINIIINFNNNY